MHSPLRTTALVLLLSFLAFAREPKYPPQVLKYSQVRDLPRSSNGGEYRLLVGLPGSYGSQPSKRYPVLYVCDGQWDFSLVYSIYWNLQSDGDVPEFILVGLSYQGESPNVDSLRSHDYSPVPDPSHTLRPWTDGHGPAFLSVLRQEIIPFIQSQYRVDTTFRALGGSSLSGIFTLYAALEVPGLFQGVIAASPAIKPFESWFLPYESAFHRTGAKLPLRLFLSTAGEEWPNFTQAIRSFHDTLETRAYTGLALKWRIIDGERHAGTKAESYSRGLRWIFQDLAPSPNGK